MKRSIPALVLLALASVALLFVSISTRAAAADGWRVTSPDHEQTFSYGTETDRVWTERNGHLALLLNFTNDPFVDRANPREYDNFTFGFPNVRLGKDGHTFYFHAPDGRDIPVAKKRSDFLGINEVKLLPTTFLIVNKPHGYLTLTLVVSESSTAVDN